ncbi:MAG: helix-turn-helix domain-containing protein [Cypionkella sp.]
MTIQASLEEQPDERGAVRRTLRLGVGGRLGDGTTASALVRNISASGMLLETATALGEGDAIAVALPEAGDCTARVVWSDAPLYGCRFAAPLPAAAVSAALLRGQPRGTPSDDGGAEDEFGTRLQRLRRERGMSLGDVAKRLGVSKPTVWAWEHGKSRPIERRLAAIAEALGVTPGGLEPAPAALPEAVERSRREIARAYGVEPAQVRIMIEL